MDQQTEIDRRMMSRALELAARGRGQVSPGPLVGTVIVDAAGEIAGEGFYLYDRVKHAETLALEQAGERARGATAYVSLEPHAHQGRTPPCTDALIKAGIRRVVAPIEDPNPKVFGRGFAHLRDAGIEVCAGLLKDEAAQLNEAYIHWLGTGRSFAHLKMALSLDGKIATRTGDSRWITGEEARARAHELRHQADAIIVGGGTARADDPLLTDRSGKTRRRPLVRVVIDQNLNLSPDSQIAKTANESPAIVFTRGDSGSAKARTLQARGIEVFTHTGLVSIFEELGRRSLLNVLVEGGATLAGLLLDADLVNKVTFFMAPILIGGQEAPSAIGGAGIDKLADALQLDRVEVERRGRDLEITGYPSQARDAIAQAGQ